MPRNIHNLLYIIITSRILLGFKILQSHGNSYFWARSMTWCYSFGCKAQKTVVLSTLHWYTVINISRYIKLIIGHFKIITSSQFECTLQFSYGPYCLNFCVQYKFNALLLFNNSFSFCSIRNLFMNFGLTWKCVCKLKIMLQFGDNSKSHKQLHYHY